MTACAIDVHAHAFPDSLAERAISTLENECPWKAVARGKVDELIASMDAAGIAASWICSIATKSDQVEAIFKWSLAVRNERIVALPSVHPDTPDAEGWLARFAEAGLPGIKLHPMYQRFALDESRMDRIYAAARDCGLFVTAHCGLDIAFPDDDDRASPARVAAVLDRFPGLCFIATHLGGWRSWDQAERYVIGRDAWLETSFALDALGAERARRMIDRHGIERVMMGSDWPWQSQTKAVQLVRELGFDEASTDKLLRANAETFLG